MKKPYVIKIYLIGILKSNFWPYFSPITVSLPRKIMEQSRLCPAKLWSNADFAPRNHRAFVFCPVKYPSLCSLPRKTMELCRLCPAKSWRHNFRVIQIIFFYFFLLISVNQCYFRDLYHSLDHFIKKKYFVTVPLRI